MTHRFRAPLTALLCTRRQLLGGVGLAAAALWGGRPAWALAGPDEPRCLTLHNTHTLESLSVAYATGEHYDDGALAAVDHALRDHRNGETRAIDRQLLDLLHTVALVAGRDPVYEVISGYRSPASNAMLHERSAGVATHSLHMEGRAIDIRLVGCDIARTRDIGLALGRGGVGYYRAPGFVHLDTGRPRTWSG